MTPESLSVVLDWIAAWNDGDLNRFVGMLHEEVEWTDRDEFPDAARYHGRSDTAAHILDIAETVRTKFDVVEAEVEGPHVFTAIDAHGAGSDSGAGFGFVFYAVTSVQDGRILRRESYSSRGEALTRLAALSRASER